jgi:polyhydroxyalkanoate synthesis regulator phasin
MKKIKFINGVNVSGAETFKEFNKKQKIIIKNIIKNNNLNKEEKKKLLNNILTETVKGSGNYNLIKGALNNGKF